MVPWNNNGTPLKEGKCEITIHLNKNICQIHCKYTMHGYKCLSKINT